MMAYSCPNLLRFPMCRNWPPTINTDCLQNFVSAPLEAFPEVPSRSIQVLLQVPNMPMSPVTTSAAITTSASASGHRGALGHYILGKTIGEGAGCVPFVQFHSGLKHGRLILSLTQKLLPDSHLSTLVDQS